MSLIKPTNSYTNTGIKFCLILENAISKHLFWNAWFVSDDDDPVGGMQLLFQMTGVKLGAAHCYKWL